MENRKATKRALLTSITALVMCVVMLAGTTFAWFTDTASTNVNKIQAGNLQLKLEMATAWGADGKPTTWADAEGQTLNWVKATAGSSQAILWEPGAEYKLPELRVVNGGDLNLKYKIVITGASGDVDLLNVIDFSAKITGVNNAVFSNVNVRDNNPVVYDKVLKPNEEDVIALSGKMQTSANNTYMSKTISGISITVYAAQATGEYDSNGSQYDEDASYPVTTTDELIAALQSKEAIVLGNDITITSMISTASNPKQTLDFNGHKLILGGEDQFDYGCLDVYGELTLVDSVGGGGITGRFYHGPTKVPTAVFINDGAVVNLKSGTIENVYRGVANYYSGGTFNMTGGKIAVKQASEIESAGVLFHRGGTVNLNSGEISGAIYFEKTATSQPSYTIGTGFTNSNNSVFNTSGVTATQNEDDIWISTIM